MLWKESVAISEKVYHNSKPVMMINRILALFPITIAKQGSDLYLKWSPVFILYSYSIGIILPILTYRGLWKDISIGRENSVKIKTSTDIYVAICDITVLELGVIFGIFSDAFGSSKFFAFLKYTYEIDGLIPGYTKKSARNYTIVMIIGILATTFYITTSDLFVYFRLTDEKISRSYIIECYMPFYITYYIILMNQYKFWYLGFAILRRLEPLNERLRASNFNFKSTNIKRIIKRRLDTIAEKIPENNFDSNEVASIVNANHKGTIFTQNGQNLFILYGKANIPYMGEYTFDQKFSYLMYYDVNNLYGWAVTQLIVMDTSTNNNEIFKLMTVYEKICDAVGALNQLYGLTNAITIISILWHLIETPYLLILEISGTRKDLMSIIVLSSWCLLHVGRLLLLAQPCYACVIEAQKTKDLVCKLILITDADQKFKSQLQDFSLLILHRKFEFTASGLATIDRSLVTSVLGAITTYLVILLQFATTE